jgi:hypothetical protein
MFYIENLVLFRIEEKATGADGHGSMGSILSTGTQVKVKKSVFS